MTEPILSRFDVLCVVKDAVDVEADRQLAQFVVKSHQRSHPDAEPQQDDDAERDPDLIDQDLLRKYIMYSRENVSPRLQDLDKDKLAKVYSALRKESIACGSIPMTVRHVESMIRMAEAHARIHLRDYVRQDDLDMAIGVMLDSFLSANKLSVYKQLKRKFAKYMNNFRDNEELLHHLLKTIAQDEYHCQRYEDPRGIKQDRVLQEVKFDAEKFESRAREFNIHSVAPFYKSATFKHYGYRLEERTDARDRAVKVIVKTL